MVARPKKILLVEDHKDSAALLARILRSYGHSVTIACSCETARQLFATERFDLLLMDIRLPDGDGCDLLEELALMRNIPAIAVTGYGMPVDTQRFKSAGFVATLIKPFQLSALQDVLAAIPANSAGA